MVIFCRLEEGQFFISTILIAGQGLAARDGLKFNITALSFVHKLKRRGRAAGDKIAMFYPAAHHCNCAAMVMRRLILFIAVILFIINDDAAWPLNRGKYRRPCAYGYHGFHAEYAQPLD